MDDVHCFQILTNLLFTSDRDAVLGNHSGLDNAKTMATRLLEDNQIFQRQDSRTYSMQLLYAQILHNHGSLDEAARIRQRVLAWRRQHKGLEHPNKLVEALRSYAQSCMALGNAIEPRELVQEALDTCKASLEPRNMYTLDCEEDLAKLHKTEGHITKAIEIIFEVLNVRQESLGDTNPQTIGTKNDLAVYLALASRWEESKEMIYRAQSCAKENLSNQDVVNLAVHLNASSLSAAMCLPVAERLEQFVATERGGRLIATLRLGRDNDELLATLASGSHDHDHKPCRRSLWKMVAAVALRLRNGTPRTAL